jgi:hypothetical protein
VLCPGGCAVCNLNKNTATNNQPSCSACNIAYFLNLQTQTCQPCGKYC